MAKRFGGFTPQQQQTLLSKMGYTGPAQQDDINKFMMSSPKAASMMGRYAQMAKARVEGGPQMAMQVGGYMAPPMPMQQQPMMPPLDYNRLYAQPNMQQQQQPIAMQTGGFAMGVGQQGGTPQQQGGQFNSMEELMEYQKKNPTANLMGEYQRLQQQMAGTMGGDAGVTPLPNPNPDLEFPDPKRDNEIEQPIGEPAYDPSQGLPEAVEAPDVTSYLEGTGAGNTAHLKEGVKNLLTSGDLPEDPSNYTITGGKRNWIITFDNGQTVKSTVRNPASAENDAKIIAEAISGYKESDIYKGYQQQKQQYNQQIEQYQQYQSDQAQTAADAPVFETIDAAQGAVTKSQNLIANYMNQLAGLEQDDPQRETLEKFIADEQIKLNQSKAGLKQAQDRAAAERKQQRMQSTTEFEADPSAQVATADVATISEAQKEAGMMAEGVGQAGDTTAAKTTTADAADDVAAPIVKEAATYDATKVTPAIEETVKKLEAATGEPSEGALAKGASMSPEELSSLGLTVDQIEEATQVMAPDRLEVQPEEMISGTVDFERAKAETNFEAATGVPSTEATVQGQLTNLLEQFEGGETPAWAAGAMRAATATLAARGLGASSMAGQAIVQAAMESALPIAQADAATRASFEAQNLSNRQQAAMFAAEQRSKFLGMEFDQEFQARVQNAARIADVANINFNAEQQIALENSRLAQTVDIANLDARNAKIMADAAAMSQVDITNLNNRQQAAIQYANSFLQMDMANLTNEQQATMFKSQSIVQSLLSDQAAENAAEQFNSTSENQTNQFYDSLTAQVDQFNVDQSNGMKRFNAGEANAIEQFNKEQENRREEFNATNALVIEQANAKWAQDIALTDTAAINQANRDAARAENDMSLAVYEAQMQAERDQMSYAFQTANNNADRATEIALQTMRNEASATTSAATKSAALASAAGAIIAEII